MNKHGFKGVRKRTDGRARPYYARVTVGDGEYIYLPSHEKAEDAAKDFEDFRQRESIKAKQDKPLDAGPLFERLA